MSGIGNSMPIDLRRRAKPARFDHGEPLSRASSLPILIFLTCLVLAGLTLDRIPVHVLSIDLVTGGSSQAWVNRPGQDVHSVVVTQEGAIEWNRERINVGELVQYLQLGMVQPIEPVVVFAPEANASYELSAHVLWVIKASGVTKFCFGELERYKDFSKGDLTYRLNLTLIDQVPHEESAAPLAEVTGMPPQCSDPLRQQP